MASRHLTCTGKTSLLASKSLRASNKRRWLVSFNDCPRYQTASGDRLNLLAKMPSKDGAERTPRTAFTDDSSAIVHLSGMG